MEKIYSVDRRGRVKRSPLFAENSTSHRASSLPGRGVAPRAGDVSVRRPGVQSEGFCPDETHQIWGRTDGRAHMHHRPMRTRNGPGDGSVPCSFIRRKRIGTPDAGPHFTSDLFPSKVPLKKAVK